MDQVDDAASPQQCLHCGYELRGVGGDSNCPECGAVAGSRPPPSLASRICAYVFLSLFFGSFIVVSLFVFGIGVTAFAYWCLSPPLDTQRVVLLGATCAGVCLLCCSYYRGKRWIEIPGLIVFSCPLFLAPLLSADVTSAWSTQFAVATALAAVILDLLIGGSVQDLHRLRRKRADSPSVQSSGTA